jgi:hypothetical protein
MACESEPHSAEQFGAQRDFWWNRDFLDRMAKRWRLGEASTLADIGCGCCHWSRLLYVPSTGDWLGIEDLLTYRRVTDAGSIGRRFKSCSQCRMCRTGRAKKPGLSVSILNHEIDRLKGLRFQFPRAHT